MMRRSIAAIQGRWESSSDCSATISTPISNLLDSHALRRSKRFPRTPRCCCLRVIFSLVMGALVVIILWTRQKSAPKIKQSFVFPVYATAFDASWQYGAPSNVSSSIHRSSLRRSLMADPEDPKYPTYYSEVRPALKHIIFQIKVEVKGKAFFLVLDTGSFATWLFCNHHPITHSVKDSFYSPSSENYISASKFQHELAEAYTDVASYLPFKECGPELQHMCFELIYHSLEWGQITAALVEDNIIVVSQENIGSKTAPINLKFGCAFTMSDTVAAVSFGVMGLGNMSISIPKQMADKGLIAHVLGFCFAYGVYQSDYDINHVNRNPVGYFVLGQPLDYNWGYQWIPMVKKSRYLPPGYGFDLIYFVYMEIGTFSYNCQKEQRSFGATLVDTGASYMTLIGYLYHHVFDIVAACAYRHGYIRTHDYGTFTVYWKSPPMDNYFSIYNHFEEMRLFFYTKDKKKYVYRISPFGYLHILAVLDIHVQGRILHSYLVGFGILEDTIDTEEITTNSIGGLALRGNKLIIDHANQQIGFKPEYKCDMPN